MSLRYLGLLLIITAVLYIATFELGKASYHNDELALLFHQSMAIPKLITFCKNWAYHPPLYFFVLKGWMLMDAGEEAFSRLLSVLFFLLIPLVPYWYRKTISIPWWQFSLLLATSYPILLLSRMVEPYSLASLFCIVSWLQALKWMDSPNRKEGILLILGLTLCFYTHYLAWAFCIIFCALLFLRLVLTKNKKKLYRFLKLGLTHFVMILPWIIYNASFKKLVLATNTFWHEQHSILDSTKEIFFNLFSNEKFLIILWLMVLISKVIYSKGKKVNLILLQLMGLFYLVLVYRSLGQYSYMLPRYFVWFVPVIYYTLLENLPRKTCFAIFILFLGLQVHKLPAMYNETWSEVREVFIYTSLQGEGRSCNKKVTVAWYNTQIHKPYVKKYGRCGIDLMTEDVCLNGLDSLIKNLKKPSLLIYHKHLCPELFEGLLLLNPNYAGIIHFKNYRLLILGQSRESFIEEINSIPGLNFSFREEIPRGNYVQ
jgi:uncharacterized membrane protein